MESDGDRPARGKSRKPKERGGENSSGKRPPVLLSEEGEGGGEKLPASKSRAKATRRNEREPSPDQEEDVIDGFVIVSFRAEESLKNALKKHCNVYENRIMQLPLTRGQGSSSWRGVGDAAAGRACASSAAVAAAAVDAAVTEESTKPCHSTAKGSSGYSNKGKENKATSAAAIACVPAETPASVAAAVTASGRPPPPLHSASGGSPTPIAACCTEASTNGKPENAKKGGAASSKQSELDLLPLTGTPTKSSTDQGPPSSSSAGPPELSAAVNFSASSTGDHPASPASEGTCQSSCAVPSPLHPQVTLGPEAPPALSVSSGKESKSTKSDSTTAVPQAGGSSSSNSGGSTTATRNSPWPSTRSGESKAHGSVAAAGVGHGSSAGSAAAAAAGMAWHTPVDGAVTAATSSMNSSQPFYSAYNNPLAAMLGMASAPPVPGAQHSVLAAPNFMANALAAAAAAGLPVMPPTGYPPDFVAYNTTLQPYLSGSGTGTTTANSIPHQQLYDQLLRTAAAAQQQQQQQQQQQAAAAAAAVAAAAAAAGMPALPPPPYGTSLVPTPSPHMYAGKAHKFDAATMALWGQAMPGAFPPALTAAAAAALHGSASATGTSPFQSIGSGIGPIFGDTSANFTTKKSGKWCAAHVKIAWQIFQSQQKSKLEHQNGCMGGGGGMSGLAGAVKSEASVGAHLASLAAAAASGGCGGTSMASASSSRSSVLSASHDPLHHRTGNGVPPGVLSSSAAGTPPMSSTRSPHGANLNYSPAAAAGAAFPTMASSRDLAEWTARLGGAAALLSLAPAVMGWPGPRPDTASAKESMAGDRSSLAFGFGRELNSGTDSADSRESHSRGSGSNKDHGKSASHRPRSRSPVRAKSREASSAAAADRVRVKMERRDHEDHVARSADRLVASRGSSAAGVSQGPGDLLLLGVAGVQHQQQQQHLMQQQAASMYGSPVSDAFHSARWLSNLMPPSTSAASIAAAAATSTALSASAGAAALSLADRRLWSPFERNASFDSSRGRPHSSAADAILSQDADPRHGAAERPHMDYRLAAAAAAAERVVPFASGGSSSSRMKLSASAPYLTGLGSTVPGATVHPSFAVNGHRPGSAAPSHGGVGSGRDRQSSPAGGILASAAAATVGTLAPGKTASPGQPCPTMQANGGASSDGAAASESEAHSR